MSTSTQSDNRLAIGGNNPPDLLTILAEDHAQLRHEVEKIADRANIAPREIKTDADLDVVGSLIKDTRALARKSDMERTAAKEPYLAGGRTVDQFFKTFSERLDRIAAVFQKIADDHARKVAAAARAKAEAEAKAAREEEARREEAARKAEEENRAKHAENHAAKADEARHIAEQAEAVAAAPVKDLARTVTASGVAAGAKGEWTFEITDYDAIDLNKLRPLIKRDAIEVALRQAVRNGARSIVGVNIFEQVKATFR